MISRQADLVFCGVSLTLHMVETLRTLRFWPSSPFESGNFFGIKRNCLTNKANRSVGQEDVVLRGKLSDGLELLEEMMSHGRVGTVGANEDVAIVR